ncbi:MAG TPA: carbohydrate kinase family protein [Solirubrobacteraceae bacterium]|nr:carbohydrate kinase family protein [Solirubrobacteraceae bacterium]
MTGAPLDLLVLGDCNPDLILSDPGLTPVFGQVETLVERSELTIGGSGAIMACAAARLGLRTAIAGVVGDDLFGHYMVEALAARGVDTRGIVVDPAARTGLTVILSRNGDRAILTDPGSIAALSADRVDPDLLRRARHVHVSSYYLQTALAPGLGGLFAAARRGGATTSVDPNWDPAEVWDSGLPALLAEIDILLPNAAELRGIAGGAPDPHRAAEQLAAAGPLVVVKLGDDGALAVRRGKAPVTAGPPRGTEPVDTVGAGDTFDAGLLCGLLAGEPLPDALSLACVCGALSTRSAGGTAGQPSLEEARAARAG